VNEVLTEGKGNTSQASAEMNPLALADVTMRVLLLKLAMKSRSRSPSERKSMVVHTGAITARAWMEPLQTMR
jgi:hypothetical protein